MALAMEKHGLHLRIALHIIQWTGTQANGIIAGFMLATAFLSMWISNTATTVMMLPIATSLIQLLNKHHKNDNFALSILLGIAFSANIGGIATIIGTPPNSVLAAFLSDQYHIEIGFARWMQVGLPFSALFLLLTYFILLKMYPNHIGTFTASAEVIQEELKKVGPITKEEKTVFWVFVCTALSWIGRGYIQHLFPNLPLSDTTIAMCAAILLFLLPTNFSTSTYLLDWKDTEKLPWGILLLFGGGLSLAAALNKVGIVI